MSIYVCNVLLIVAGVFVFLFVFTILYVSAFYVFCVKGFAVGVVGTFAQVVWVQHVFDARVGGVFEVCCYDLVASVWAALLDIEV